MILTDRMLTAAISQGKIKIEPFDNAHIQPASYDLSVGVEAITSSSRKKINIKENGFVEIDAGDFVILTSEEIITLDNQHVGRFGLRSKWAKRGLIATTGPQIDPGFNGRLKIGLTNLSSRKIALSHREHLLTVEFHELYEPVKRPYTGESQNQEHLDQDDLETVLDREVMSLSEMHQTLRTLCQTVNSLEESVKSVKWVVVSGTAFIALSTTITGVAVAIIN